MAEIISLAMQKGGVAKTTSTANIAAVLVQHGKQVLGVDLDPQANLTFNLGINPMKMKGSSIYNLIFEDGDPNKIIKETKSGIDLINSHQDLYASELKFLKLLSEGNSIGRLTFLLKRILGNVLKKYDYTLIDCPPSLGMLTVNALMASDSVLIPVKCDFYSFFGLGMLLENIERSKKGNPKLSVRGIFGTEFDPRTNLSSDIMQKIRQFGEQRDVKVFDTAISKCVKHGEAPGWGLPSVLAFEKNELVQQYVTLTKEVFGL